MSHLGHDYSNAQLAGCVGKTPISSWEEADRAATKMRRKHGIAFTVYRCRHCGMFHVGEEAL